MIVLGVNKKQNQHTSSLLQGIELLLWSDKVREHFRFILAIFLNCNLRTTLDNVKGISTSTASRFFSTEQASDDVLWNELNKWQFTQWQSLSRRGRRGDVVLKLDLSCVEKTGKRIPFARVFNKRYGIQIVVLHACMDGLSFPLAYKIYEGKGKASVAELAFELLAAFPASTWSSSVVVMADSGFASHDFIKGCNSLGFKRLLVGIRCDRKLSDGRRLDQLKRRGDEHQLHDLDQAVWISWCDVKREEAKKRYYLLSTFKAGGAYLARRYRRRWLIESFFKSVKHDFGLKEARLRTVTGIRLWLFLSCLAYSLAMVEQILKRTGTLLEAAYAVLMSLAEVVVVHLMIELEVFNNVHQHRLKLVCA